MWLSVVCILCLDGVVGWMGWMGQGVEEMGGWGVDGWMIGVVVVPSLGRAGVGVQGPRVKGPGSRYGAGMGMGGCGWGGRVSECVWVWAGSGLFGLWGGGWEGGG